MGRVLALVAALLAIAAGTYFGFNWYFGPPAAPLENPAAEAERRAEANALCTAALSTAKRFGIIPVYTELSGDVVERSETRGRYTCSGHTDAAKYRVTFDLMCKNIDDAKCIELYTVAQDRTGPIYQRR